MADVSVIIVTWNNDSEIEQCIDSLIKSSNGLSIELVLIDNNSSDGTYDKLLKINYHNLHVYRNFSNLGFTKAVNQGIRFSTSPLVMFLNPDTIVKNGALDLMSGFLKGNKQYGASCPLMLNKNKTIQYSIRNFPAFWSMFCEFSLLAYLFPKTRLFGNWKMKYFKYDKDADVSQPMAAALMVNRKVLEMLNGMDERFEMFFNDVDLCKRIINAGCKIRFIKDSVIIHYKGKSIYKKRAKMINTWNRDCLAYFEKHHPRKLLLLWLKISLKLSGIVRILLYRIINFFRFMRKHETTK
jgi:hypothetical protein